MHGLSRLLLMRAKHGSNLIMLRRLLSLGWMGLLFLVSAPWVRGEVIYLHNGIPIFIPDELINSRSFSIHLSKEFLEESKPFTEEIKTEKEPKEEEPTDLEPEEEETLAEDEEPDIPFEDLLDEDEEPAPEEEFPEEALSEKPPITEEEPPEEEALEEDEKEDEEDLPPLPPETNVGRLMLKAYATFKRGQLEKSMTYLDQAERLAPKHPTIKTMKGSIYYRLGLLQEARKFWLESLKLNPNQQSVRKFLEKIGSNPPPKEPPDTPDDTNLRFFPYGCALIR